jgi:hypothetical protein
MSWWESLKIKVLPIAKQLWEQTHPESAPSEIQSNGDAVKASTED